MRGLGVAVGVLLLAAQGVSGQPARCDGVRERSRADGHGDPLAGGRAHRRPRRRRGVEDRGPDPRLPAIRSRAGRGAHARHGGPGGLRRRRPVRLRASAGSPPRQHHAGAEPQGRARPLRPDRHLRRFLPRPTDGLRVLREPGRREARLRGERRLQRGLVLERRVGRGHAGGRARVDGRVPHPALAAPLRRLGDAHVGLRRAPHRGALPRVRGVAGLQPHHAGAHVADGHAGRPRGSRLRRSRRDDALRGGQEPDPSGRQRLRPPRRDDDGRRPEDRDHAQRDAERHREPRLRPGGGRPRRAEPRRLRDLLPGAPPLLRGGYRALHLLAQLLHRGRLQHERGALLLAPHRPGPIARGRVR